MDILLEKDIDWKYKIGDHIKSEKQDFVITDKKFERKIYKNNKIYNYKLYKYHCNVCGWDNGWIKEYELSIGNGCRCCAGQIVVKGINTLGDKRPDLIKYFKNPEDAFTVLPRTDSKKVDLICPLCDGKTQITPDKLTTRGFKCRFCDDGFSYPEKFMYNFLNQLKLEVITQLNKSHFQWIGEYKYDFYLKHYNYIIETHGKQHYIIDHGIDRLLKEQENDKNKEHLAKNNGVSKYIIIDCRNSTLEWIKNSIMTSELPDLIKFKENDIDWELCHKNSINTLVKTVSDLWNNYPDYTIIKIAEKVGLGRSTVRKYLQQANDLGWCSYSAEKGIERKNVSKNLGSPISIDVYKDGIYLFTYPSATKLAKNSIELFGVQMNACSIREVCRGIYKTHKGYVFKNSEH